MSSFASKCDRNKTEKRNPCPIGENKNAKGNLSDSLQNDDINQSVHI